jgi:hypothetical protein
MVRASNFAHQHEEAGQEIDATSLETDISAGDRVYFQLRQGLEAQMSPLAGIFRCHTYKRL